MGTIEKEWIWANSSINEYNYYLREIREAHDEFLAKNPSRKWPTKEFYANFDYPIHPQYAMDVINAKTREIMEEAYGNPSNQTLLHCAVDCMRFATQKTRGYNKLVGMQNWFCCSLVNAGMAMYGLDKRSKMAIEYAIGEPGQTEQ